jgi:hypothetical protein
MADAPLAVHKVQDNVYWKEAPRFVTDCTASLPALRLSLQAVERFYIELVAGRASLADIGLAPAAAAPAAALGGAANHQPEQQQQQQESLQEGAMAQPAQEEVPAGDAQQAQQLQRRTFKVAADSSPHPCAT